LPISREEFEAGRIDLALPVASLLGSAPELAFTAVEIQRMLMETAARDATLGDILDALETLVSQGKVQRKRVRGSVQEWYSIVRLRLGFLRE
jgi:hypothetical protein